MGSLESEIAILTANGFSIYMGSKRLDCAVLLLQHNFYGQTRCTRILWVLYHHFWQNKCYLTFWKNKHNIFTAYQDFIMLLYQLTYQYYYLRILTILCFRLLIYQHTKSQTRSKGVATFHSCPVPLSDIFFREKNDRTNQKWKFCIHRPL